MQLNSPPLYHPYMIITMVIIIIILLLIFLQKDSQVNWRTQSSLTCRTFGSPIHLLFTSPTPTPLSSLSSPSSSSSHCHHYHRHHCHCRHHHHCCYCHHYHYHHIIQLVITEIRKYSHRSVSSSSSLALAT